MFIVTREVNGGLPLMGLELKVMLTYHGMDDMMNKNRRMLIWLKYREQS